MSNDFFFHYVYSFQYKKAYFFFIYVYNKNVFQTMFSNNSIYRLIIVLGFAMEAFVQKVIIT